MRGQLQIAKASTTLGRLRTSLTPGSGRPPGPIWTTEQSEDAPNGAHEAVSEHDDDVASLPSSRNEKGHEHAKALAAALPTIAHESALSKSSGLGEDRHWEHRFGAHAHPSFAEPEDDQDLGGGFQAIRSQLRSIEGTTKDEFREVRRQLHRILDLVGSMSVVGEQSSKERSNSKERDARCCSKLRYDGDHGGLEDLVAMRRPNGDSVATMGRCSVVSTAFMTEDVRQHAPLPAHWPMSLPMRAGLQTAMSDRDSSVVGAFTAVKETSYNMATSTSVKKHTGRMLRNFLSFKKVYSPHSMPVMIVDFIGMVVLMHDLLVTPFVLSWDVPVNGVLNILSVASGVYWTAQLLVNFKTGFYSNGELIMSQSAVILHYLTRRFLLDAALVALDWVNIAIQGFSAAKGLRVLKVTRLAKVLRLLTSLSTLDKVLTESRVGSGSRGGAILVKITLFTIFCTHWASCAWFAIGTYNATPDTGARWPDELMQTRDNWADWSGEDMPRYGKLYQYLTSYHWALAQLTCGNVEINATNSMERAFCIMLMICGIMFSSTILSVISMQATEWVTVRRTQMDSIATLDQFLAQVKVDPLLAARVRRQASDRILGEVQPLSEESVAALSKLSSDLRVELLRRTRRPHLERHPLFKLWADMSVRAMNELCDIVKYKALATEDVAFMPLSPAAEALCLVRGTMSYLQDESSSMLREEVEVRVHERTWLCEAALWCEWFHVGKLTALSTCYLLAVSARGVVEIAAKHKTVGQMTRTYAQSFCKRVHAAMPPFAQWPSDLQVPSTDVSELVAREVSVGLLERAYANDELSCGPEVYASLLKQVEDGRCAINMLESGELQRTLFVCALRVEREDFEGPKVLVQVGRWSGRQGDAAAPVGLLPGIKRSPSELPKRVIRRLLEQELAPFQRGVRLSTVEEQVELKESERFGIKTRYFRTIAMGTLDPEFRPPPLIALPVEDMRHSRSLMRSAPGHYRRRQDLLQAFMEYEVFLVATEKRGVGLFAWFTREHFELLTTQVGRELLREWVAGLAMPTDHLGPCAFDDFMEPDTPVSTAGFHGRRPCPQATAVLGKVAQTHGGCVNL